MITVLLIICAIVFILALLYIIGCLVEKRMISARKKYQDHIDDLVEELFPPSIEDASIEDASIPDTSITDPTIQLAVPVPTANEPDPMYQEAKRKMVADIRTYFNRRKINSAAAKKP